MEKKKYISSSSKALEEWDFESNKSLDPNKLTLASNKRAVWKCTTCHYKWEAKISNRLILGRGCPLCANKVVISGQNDLATTHPELAEEWHPTKNKDLKLSKVSYGSGKKAWWICPNGHDFQATINHRSSGTGCPVCHSGRQTSFAEQATYFYVKQLYPDAISRYTSSFLGRMELDIYIPSINYAIEYDGEAWHKKDTIQREQSKYERCQKQGIKLIRMREKFPELGSMIADYQFGVDGLYKIENLENVIIEILKRLNFSKRWPVVCPIDVNIGRDRFKIQAYRTALKDKTLLLEFPEISKEWHPTKNLQLSPSMFKPRSDQKVWWKCVSCSYEYESTIGHRTYGTGCPKCAIEKVTKVKQKPVKMIDPITDETLETFVSISDASRKLNINGSNITSVCKGLRQKAGGYFWVYINED
jgi:Zn finger protein HypA/HybF involved in hydrogenase expression